MNDQQERKGHGCFFYGCMTIIVLIIAVVCIAVAGGWWVVKKGLSYTDTQPLQIALINAPSGEVAECRKRWDTFIDTVRAGARPAQITMSSRDLNILLQTTTDPELAKLRGKVDIKLDGDRATGHISIPLNAVPLATGRYANGEGEFDISCDNGLLSIRLNSLKVRGEPVPDAFMASMKEINLAADLYKDPRKVDALKRLKSVKIQNSLVTIDVLPKAQ